MLRLALTCLLAASTVPALAQEEAYIDDRSGPSALVRSLYNAVNRGEFARAWSYFAEPPASDPEAYAQGYADTEHIELLTGTPHEEGAAGSIYFELPVAILSRGSDGSERVHAGCYTLRLAGLTVGETFEPLHIESGTLEPSDAAFSDALPRSCRDGVEMPEHDALLERAKAMFDAVAQEICWAGNAFGDDGEQPESHAIGFNYRHDDADQPERTARLFRFFCDRGAYNERHLYFIANDDGEVSPLHFAHPELDIRYEDDDIDKGLQSVTVTGFGAKAGLVNSRFDPQTRTISEHSYWRGLGDASSSGTWAFDEGGFRLVHYEVDASYDAEVNPEVLIDYDTAP